MFSQSERVEAMSLYDDLGVASDADAAAIKRAHRAAAKRHHPDAGGDRNAFDLAQRAYATLIDDSKRAKYDATGEEDAPDNTKARAMECLANSFTVHLMERIEDDLKLNASDLMADVRRDLAEQVSAGKVYVSKLRVDVARLEKASRRLKFKGRGHDVLGTAFEQRIRGIRAQISANEVQVEVVAAAALLAKDYDWETATGKPMQSIFILNLEIPHYPAT